MLKDRVLILKKEEQEVEGLKNFQLNQSINQWFLKTIYSYNQAIFTYKF